MPAVTIRSATPEDLPVLLELYRQLSPGAEASSAEDAVRGFQAMTDAAHVTLLVAEVDGLVAGTVTLVVVPNLTHGAKPWAQVENMVVEENVRGSGVGKKLIEACLDTARAKGCYKVQLQSANHRREAPHDAHAFYAAMGFEPSSVGFRRYFE
jgi:N-acetylglutamate synthase-like GNAT family acetyltransferase